MARSIILVMLICCIFISCTSTPTADKMLQSKTEIVETEKAFAAMAKKEGLAAAFSYFADENAVINYNDILITGRYEIKAHYSDARYKDVLLEWAPDFVDVSSSCDLGYTYGKYIYSKKDTTGNIISAKGIFHTVWKKQQDGTWRYVYD